MKGFTIPCYTDDDVDHGLGRLEDCFEAVITRYEYGCVSCPILWSGSESCYECMQYHLKEDD